MEGSKAIADPWLSDPDAVAADLYTDPTNGLAQQEAAARMLRFGPNVLAPKAPVPVWRKLLQQFADPLVVLLARRRFDLAWYVGVGPTGCPWRRL